MLTFDRPDGAVRFLAVEVAEDELVPAWHAGRRLVERTGRWPVVGNPYPQARRDEVAAALAAGDAVSSTSITAHRCAPGRDRIEAIRRSQSAVWDETANDARLAYELTWTRSVYGRATDADEARRNMQATDSVYTLDRWLMNWEERQPHQPSTRSDRYPDWFWDGGPLVFLPARRSAEVCVYLDFWGEQASPGATPAAIAQIIDYWAVQYRRGACSGCAACCRGRPRALGFGY